MQVRFLPGTPIVGWHWGSVRGVLGVLSFSAEWEQEWEQEWERLAGLSGLSGFAEEMGGRVAGALSRCRLHTADEKRVPFRGTAVDPDKGMR